MPYIRNRIALLLVAMLCVGLILIPSSHAREVAIAVDAIQSGEVVLEIDPNSSIDEINARNGTITKRHINGTNYYQIEVPVGQESTYRSHLALDPGVLNAALNPIMYSPYSVSSRSVMGFPGDRATPGLDAIEYQAQRELLERLVGLDQAQVRSSGAGTTVAVIDTGIDLSHPALASHVHPYGRNLIGEGNGYDPSESAGDPETTVAGHGTFISGLIALMAPDCRIMAIKAFSPAGESDEFTVAEGIKEAVDHGADVINMSCGTRDDSKIIRDAVTYARQHGAILAAAVGNNSTDQVPEYPASITEGVLGVASIDLDDECSSFSNYGTSVSVAAFGHDAVSAYPGGTYARWSGTSFATPLIAAEAALILGGDPNARTTRRLLEATAVDITNRNPDRRLGYGRFNPAAALQSVSTNAVVRPTADLYAQVDLANTGIQPGASGRAEIFVAGSLQEFRVRAFGLKPDSIYSCVVDGLRLIEGSSSPFGGLELVPAGITMDSFGASLLPPTFIVPPNVTQIGKVELRDAQDRTLLWGRFTAVPDTKPPEQLVRKELRLYTAGLPPLATGLARVEVQGAAQRALVAIEGLSDGSYQIMIDGADAGIAVASRGFLRIDNFSGGTGNLILPPSVASVVNISRIRVLGPSGMIAQGTFAFSGGHIGR
ncbi:MAG TPA: S8 family serine peptidase [Blastocatellia bacterium]|nr:S8 family serine peptidase [Blastocatellia bacterium]